MRIVLFIIFILISLSVNAQDIEKIKTKINKLASWTDTNYVYTYPHRIVVNPTFYLRTNSFSLEDNKDEGESIIYRPNTPMKFAISASYKWLSLGVAFKIPSYLNDKGDTKTFSIYLGTQTHFANWGLDFFLVKNKGYYLANPETMVPGWNDRYPFRSDLETINIGFSSHLVLSRKLSLKAALNQTQKQLKSAGGFAIQVGMNFSNLRSDSTLIPYSQQDYYKEATLFRKGGYLSINIRPGYAYTYVYKDFYSTTFALLGLGFQVQSYQTNQQKWGAQIMPQFRFQQVLGYNAGNTFIKLMFIYSSNNYKIERLKLKNNFVTISLGGGLRFE